MVKKRIYLAGNISSDPATYKWREKAEELLEPDYTVLNPAANKFNKKLLKESKGDVAEFVQKAIDRSQEILIAKDHQLVDSADIILVNLTIITPEKPLIGTLYELAWSWLAKKPVIAIVADNIYCKHPFPASTFSATVATLDEAVELIKYFFVE